MEVTWFRSGTPLSNSTSQVTISPLAESGRTFTSNLTLSPLYPEDNTSFTCMTVGRPKTQQHFITASELAMDNNSLTVMLRGKCDELLWEYLTTICTIFNDWNVQYYILIRRDTL